MKFRNKSLVAATLFFTLFFGAISGHAKPAPDQDLSDFPPWIWPIIRTAAVISEAVSNPEIDFEEAVVQIKEAVAHQCECFGASEYQFTDMLTMVNAQFEVQLATVKTAQTKMAGFASGKMVALDDDDWCGTPPKPIPWPWPYVVMDLVKMQADMFRNELITNHKLSEEEIKILDSELGAQMDAFETVLY